MYDYLDPRIAWPLAIVLWATVLWIYLSKFVKVKIDAYFAGRRQKRRERELDRTLQTAVRLGAMSISEARAYKMVPVLPQRTNAN